MPSSKNGAPQQGKKENQKIKSLLDRWQAWRIDPVFATLFLVLAGLILGASSAEAKGQMPLSQKRILQRKLNEARAQKTETRAEWKQVGKTETGQMNTLRRRSLRTRFGKGPTRR
jgi:hypothetical protein